MRSIACRLHALLLGALGVLAMLTGLALLCGLAACPSPDVQAPMPAQPFSMGLSAAMAAIGMGGVTAGFLFGFLSLLAGRAARSVPPTVHRTARCATINSVVIQAAA